MPNADYIPPKSYITKSCTKNLWTPLEDYRRFFERMSFEFPIEDVIKINIIKMYFPRTFLLSALRGLQEISLPAGLDLSFADLEYQSKSLAK